MNTRRMQGIGGTKITHSFGSVWTIFALLLLIAGMFCTPVSAATFTVGGDGYATISEVLTIAQPGDTILVESGTYYEHLNISIPVTITGIDTGGGLPVIEATGGEAAIVLKAGRTTVGGLVITGTTTTGIFVHSDNNVITGNTISPTIPGRGLGIVIYDSNRTLVTGNHLEGLRLGLLITESDGTMVYYNDIDAENGAISSSPETSWVSPVTTYEYEGTSFEGVLGNHWGGYTGADTEGDGIGNEPYSFTLSPKGQPHVFTEGNGPIPFERTASGLVGGVAGIAMVEDDAPLVAEIHAYTVSLPWDVQDTLLKPGDRLLAAWTDGRLALPWEPETMMWPAIAFMGSLLVAGVLTVADRRARHRSILNRSGHTVPVLTAGYTILAVLCSSAMFLAGFQSFMFFGNLGSSTLIVGGLAFLSVGGVILAATTATERSPHYLLGAYLTAGGIVAFTSLGLVIIRTGGPGGRYVPVLLSLTAILVGFYHRSRLVPPHVPEDTDERTRIAPVGDPFDETQIMDSQLRDVYFPATLMDRYRDVSFIGKGGLARVFRAVRREDGAVVAVKVPISFDETTGRIFLKEMKLWEGLSHPNIVRICSVNILPVPYVEMEYVPGSLAGATLPLPPAEAAAIVADIVRGLAYAHEQGIIHRDIKPHNILIAEDGTAKITDWGLGTVMGDGHESSIVGFSIQYAAPEQIAPRRYGDADVRTDIYQAGIVFYELLIGRRPFEDGGLGEMTDAILGETPTPPSSVVPAAAPWDEIVLRCIAKEMGDRHPTATAMEEALHAVSENQ